MIIYNVTNKIQQGIENPWLEWLKKEHIPDIIDTGCFASATILKLLDIDDSDGPTYAVQYFTENRSFYDKYVEQYAPEMRQKNFDKWGDKVIGFRSVMEVVN